MNWVTIAKRVLRVILFVMSGTLLGRKAKPVVSQEPTLKS